MGEREVQMMRTIGMMMIVTRMTADKNRFIIIIFFLNRRPHCTNSTIIIDECENDGDCARLSTDCSSCETLYEIHS